MIPYVKQYINGKWLEGRGSDFLENRNPFSGDLLYRYKSAAPVDINDAFAAAAAAQPLWAATSAAHKQSLLDNLAHVIHNMRSDILSCLIEESGSVHPKVDFEFSTTLEMVKAALSYPHMMEGKILQSNIPGKQNFIIKEPKGVIAVIAPWNVPLVLAIRSVIPAIATGNAVVLKPASDTPASAFLIADFFDRAGFPPGLLNVVAGKGSDIGDLIVSHPTPSLISFTGSTAVGRRIGELAGRNLKDVSLELGGNNAMIVLNDADVQRAAAAAAFGAFFHQGQVCMALNRIIVLPHVYDSFLDAFIREVSNFHVGDPANPDTFIGPIINPAQIASIETLIRDTLSCGATAALQGKTVGNLIYPWILADVTNDMPAAKNEVFGPVCCVIKASNEDEAVSIANDTEYGLSGSVFTSDPFHGMQLAQRINSGMVHVNDQSINDEPHVMFGGEKASGIGRFNAKWVVDKFTRERWISIQNPYRF